MTPPALCGLSPRELAALLSPLPRFRAAQIFKWIVRGVSSFEEMSDLPLALRRELGSRFTLRAGTVEGRYGDDGAVKLRLGLADGAKIEAVLLADKKGRRTACLSTQVGCPAGCVFCKTGSLGFTRNLSPAEIVEQFLFLRDAAADGDAISNIVIMGMGEPLLNLAGLRKALAVITGKDGMCFSKRRVTVSTCGITDGIADIADNGPETRLALSLTTADEALRRRLMPIAGQYPLAGLKKALRYFQRKGGGRVTLEAVLLGGINTRREDAAAIAEFAAGLDAVVNLIPWNPVEGLALEGKALREPAAKEVEAFAVLLQARGLKVTRRFRRGRAVCGACGQLGMPPARIAEAAGPAAGYVSRS
jgi:23S rRNA (adenine2503-C2)-methyltransferase